MVVLELESAKFYNSRAWMSLEIEYQDLGDSQEVVVTILREFHLRNNC